MDPKALDRLPTVKGTLPCSTKGVRGPGVRAGSVRIQFLGWTMLAVGAVIDAIEVAQSDDPGYTGAEKIGGWGGMWAGGELGALVGSAFGPIGTVIGGIIGGAAGYMGGEEGVRYVVGGIKEAQEYIEWYERKHGRIPPPRGLTMFVVENYRLYQEWLWLNGFDSDFDW